MSPPIPIRLSANLQRSTGPDVSARQPAAARPLHRSVSRRAHLQWILGSGTYSARALSSNGMHVAITFGSEEGAK